jgi:excisionase family DNA binding protein
MKTYDVHEAADFLKIDRSTALELASTGVLPGAKVGRAWVFMEDELVNYLRDITRKQTQERRAEVAAQDALRRPHRPPQLKDRGRRSGLPELPELPSEVAPAKI